MYFGKFLFYLVIFFQIIHVSVPRCNEHKDCRTCTNHRTWSRESCRWCPLDQECHAKWSPRNHCKRKQNVVRTSKCDTYSREKFKYNATEAYKLAMFSAIAYSDTPTKCLHALFPKSDYSVVSVFRRNCDDYIFDYDKKCLAFLAYSHRNREVIVSFRGTRGIKQIVDQIFSSIGLPSVPSAVGGKVQHYFNNIQEMFYHYLKNLVFDLKNWFPTYRVKLTGHSLGGATASIISAMLVKQNILKPEDISLYTFGMPRVGNKHYALAHDKLVPDSWRVVRHGDIVARLPTCGPICSLTNGPYHHGNKVLYPGAKMSNNSLYVVCDGNEDSYSECKKSSRNKRELAMKLKRKRRELFKYSMDKHKNFFGIPIGTYCRDHVLKHN